MGGGHRPQETVGHDARILLTVHVLADDHELVTAEARRGVARTQGGPEPLGHACQHPIAPAVADAVVDRFEAVEVDEHDRHRAGMARRARQGLPQAVHAQRAVREAGERIVERLVGQPFLCPLALGDVLGLRDEVERLAIGVGDERRADQHPDHLPFGVPVALLHLVVTDLSGKQLLEVRAV